MLKVGLLSSWNTICGISEYSRSLVQAMRRRGDLHVQVFGSRNFGERDVRAYEQDEVPVMDIQAWHPEKKTELDVETILAADLEVLHIQYSSLFYNRRRLVDLMRRFDGVLAVTYHDKVLGRGFPWQLADLLFAHREDVGLGPRKLIPQGIDVRPPVVKTFGLGGKSRDVDMIADICARNGWQLETTFGRQSWMETEDLREWLRDSDAIVLWYPEVKTSGGSASAPLAIGTRRLVFVNDTLSFSDLPERTANLRKVSSPEELELAMREELVNEYAEARSWDRVAAFTVDSYRKALAGRNGARARRAPLSARVYTALDYKPLSRVKHRLSLR
ncbi:MAG TPA: hypothetical protein VH650_11510 [Gaiellaceae bacterium]|jgi:hypothetical protein